MIVVVRLFVEKHFRTGSAEEADSGRSP